MQLQEIYEYEKKIKKIQGLAKSTTSTESQILNFSKTLFEIITVFDKYFQTVTLKIKHTTTKFKSWK